jgi:formate dehydrogenase subunit gamma
MNQKIQEIISQHQSVKGALLPLLHAIQDELGYIPPDCVGDIAKNLNLSRAEVHGVITYYHFFRQEAPGKNVVQVCKAEACQACGSEELLHFAEKILGCKEHETTLNGQVTLEPVYCLGMCASSPAIQVGDQIHARMNSDKLKKILEKIGGTK